VQGHTNEGVATTTIDHVVKNSPAKSAGFEPGDRIVAIDGKRVAGWEDLVAKIEARPNKATEFTVVRDGERVQLAATPRARGDQGFLGIGPTAVFRSISPLEAVPESFRAVGDITAGTVSGLAHLFSPEGLSEYGKNFTSDAPKAGTPAADARPRSLVGIVDVGSEIVGGNWVQLLWLLGAISLILAIFNTLPLLPFDGGHAAVVVYEAIASRVKKREVRADFRKLMPMTAIVLAIFLTLGLSAMFLDIRDAIGS
jgi:membrane-associated protease RseP (regulator of RpoE activity)